MFGYGLLICMFGSFGLVRCFMIGVWFGLVFIDFVFLVAISELLAL